MSLLPTLHQYLQTAAQDFQHIDPRRKTALGHIAAAIQQQLQTEGTTALNYICTHNSRRSHMGQLWATAAAAYYHIPAVTCYSGGTEVTAFHPNAIKALQDAGFEINTTDTSTNPHYTVRYATAADPVIAFSKKYMDAPAHYIAVMTCAHADDNCPVVIGAIAKIATPYQDPKEADGTSEQDAVYRDRCRQIATEVLYTFSLLT